MISVDGKGIKVTGHETEFLAELGLLIKVASEAVGRDKILEVCLIGLYAEDSDAMERVHNHLEAAGLSGWKRKEEET